MSPMKVPEDPMCDFLNDTYREYQDVFEEKTNHPFIEPEGLCPFPAGQYWYKNLVVDGSKLPYDFEEGYYRVTILITGVESTMELNVYLTLAWE